MEAVAYQLLLPLQLYSIHNVFPISVLRKYEYDPSHVMENEPLELRKNMSYTEQYSNLGSKRAVAIPVSESTA